MIQPMKPEQTRREQFTEYAAMLRERFQSGLLSELQTLPQWVVWRSELEDGKSKKVPYNPNYHLGRASVKIPKSWGTLESALKALATGNYSGLGFMITPPFVFIDLDHSYDRGRGNITDEARKIVTSVNSYTEVSPSGTGLHILAYGHMPGNNFHTDIEMYSQNRFTTITTDHLAETPITIERRQEAIDSLYRTYAPPVEERPFQNTRGVAGSGNTLSALPPEAADDEKLQRLLRGNITEYTSQSSADFVLIMKLLHWTGDNVALTRDLFLSSPLGQRAKAERPTGATTYVDMTIYNVLRKRRNPPQRR